MANRVLAQRSIAVETALVHRPRRQSAEPPGTFESSPRCADDLDPSAGRRPSLQATESSRAVVGVPRMTDTLAPGACEESVPSTAGRSLATAADQDAATPEARSETPTVCRGGRSLPRALRRLVLRDAAADDLAVDQDWARCALDSIGDAVAGTDVACRVTYLNAVAERLTGWSRAAAAGRRFEEVFHIVDASTREPVENPMARAIVERRPVALGANAVLISRGGVESAIEDSASPIRTGSGDVSGAVMVFRDVSVARAHAQRLEHLVQHDSLTGVANRLLFNDRLTQAVALARREQRQVALLFVDVDHFKSFNDSLGHEIGDRLLRSVALRLVSCVRSSDTVGRVGGDEFAILLPEVEQAQDAAWTAKAVLRAFARPHCIGQREFHISLSIGIATFPSDGVEAKLLLTRADLAMYRAKAGGRNRVSFFTGEPIAVAVK